MPACELKLDFASFDEFMQKKIGRVFRQNLRRKFKKLAKRPPIDMEVVSDITPVVDEVYSLYLQTFERSRFRFEKLTPDFLCAAGRQMPDRARFFLWRIDGRLVAFALCMLHADTLYDLNIGLDYAVAFDFHLYFVTRRDILQWAVENGVHGYHVGPLNYHPKLHFRMELAPLDLYARHLSPWINPLFKFAIGWLQPARHDPFIPQFPNASDL
jgi:predicted N-acyltransferase